jgi:hypothetical protein
MIPINMGNVRDVLIAGIIVASLYGLIRLPHYHAEVRPSGEIRWHTNLGEKGSRRPPSSKAAIEQVQQDCLSFSHVKIRSEQQHWRELPFSGPQHYRCLFSNSAATSKAESRESSRLR